MAQPASISSPTEQSLQTCRHHWVIQPAAGPVSPGVCQTCDEVRGFKNYIPDPSWDDFSIFSSYKDGSLERYRASSSDDSNLSPGYRADSAERTGGLVYSYRENDDEA